MNAAQMNAAFDLADLRMEGLPGFIALSGLREGRAIAILGKGLDKALGALLAIFPDEDEVELAEKLQGLYTPAAWQAMADLREEAGVYA